jgi:putative membrane protein
MLLRTITGAALALLIGLVAGRAEDKKPTREPFDDVAFAEVTAMDAMHQVELGKIGSAQAKRDEVKMFAEALHKDHAAAHEQLKAVAKAANITLPVKMGEKYQQRVNAFRNYKGENFDRDFLKYQIESHTESAAMFTRASKDARNKTIKDFAAKTLPTLQKHLEHARKLDK